MDQHTALLDKVSKKVDEGRFQEALDLLIPSLYPDKGSPAPALVALREQIFAALGRHMQTAQHPPKTKMKFGTSGWRGLLGDDFTVENVKRVTHALCQALLDGTVPYGMVGVQDADEIRRRGMVLAHDTRFFGPEFADAAAEVLLHHGVPIVYLGVATTPEVSAAIAQSGAAFSINLTPSHNPYFYHGFKFNPSDGGPATSELTGPITARATALFESRETIPCVDRADLARAREDGRIRLEDPVALYRQALSRKLPFLDLEDLCRRVNKKGIHLYIDNGFGAATGKYERLLSSVEPRLLHVVNRGPDFLFGGQNQEPSIAAYKALQAQMAADGIATGAALGFMNDGDGDRFLGGGTSVALPMNRFGPLVVRYLTKCHGLAGDVTRSVMTSHMADAARLRYLPDGKLHITKVGFQHLKAHVKTSVNAFEESDGMSPMGWSCDKDGILASLLLIAMVVDERCGESPEDLDRRLTEELGHFFFERRKVVLPMSGDSLGKHIMERFSRLGPTQELPLSGDGPIERVRETSMLDGMKIVCESGAWFGVRPSGTEPAVRIYAETFAPPSATKDQIAQAQRQVERILTYAESSLRG